MNQRNESAPHNGTDTSRAAAKAVAPKTPTMRERVLRVVLEAGEDGVTCDQVENALSMKHQTASARLYELRKCGAIAVSDKRRKTTSGSTARIYVLAVLA